MTFDTAAAIDAYVDSLHTNREPDGYWHPSSLSGCLRQAVYDFRGSPESNPRDKRSQRILRVGHIFHEFVQQAIHNIPSVQTFHSEVGLAGLLVMGVAAINLALLRLAGTLWDVITVQHDRDRMTELIGIFIGLVLLQGLCSMGHSYLTAWISQRVVADFPTHLFAHLQSLAVSFFARRRTGELLSRLMNDVTVIQCIVTETSIDTAKQLVTFLGGIGFLLAMNWRLCLLILLLLPLLVLVAK